MNSFKIELEQATKDRFREVFGNLEDDDVLREKRLKRLHKYEVERIYSSYAVTERGLNFGVTTYNRNIYRYALYILKNKKNKNIKCEIFKYDIKGKAIKKESVFFLKSLLTKKVRKLILIKS